MASRRNMHWIILLIAIIGALALPASSEAMICPAYSTTCGERTVHQPIGSRYTGWAYVRGSFGICNFAGTCSPGETEVMAWRWNGRWTPTTLRRDERAYAYPYSGSWHWAWTQRTGWVAIETSRLYIITPIFLDTVAYT